MSNTFEDTGAECYVKNRANIFKKTFKHEKVIKKVTK